MNIKQLEAFQAVMTYGSTKAAAENLAISQSGISRLLTQLELDLGLELFIRNKGRLLPKPEAEELLLSTLEITDKVNQLSRQADEMRLGRFSRRLIKIAVPYTLALNFMPDFIQKIMSDNPHFVIEILTGNRRFIESKVEKQEADFGFTRCYETPRFIFDPIGQCPAVCVMPKGHPLNQLDVISARDLVSTPMVLLGRQSRYRADIDFFFHEQGVKPKVKIEVHSVGIACQFVAKGLGVSIVNSALLNSLDTQKLEQRPLQSSSKYTYGLIFKAGKTPSKAVENLSSQMKLALKAVLL